MKVGSYVYHSKFQSLGMGIVSGIDVRQPSKLNIIYTSKLDRVITHRRGEITKGYPNQETKERLFRAFKNQSKGSLKVPLSGVRLQLKQWCEGLSLELQQHFEGIHFNVWYGEDLDGMTLSSTDGLLAIYLHLSFELDRDYPFHPSIVVEGDRWKMGMDITFQPSGKGQQNPFFMEAWEGAQSLQASKRWLQFDTMNLTARASYGSKSFCPESRRVEVIEDLRAYLQGLELRAPSSGDQNEPA